MNLKSTLITSLTFIALPTLSFGQTAYNWTGAAADGDWANAANWDANGIPVDDQAGTGNSSGLTLSDLDSITFSGTDMPTLNIPNYGGNFDNQNNGANSTPTLVLSSGGALNLTSAGRDSGFWTNRNQTGVNRTILTVGDGVSGATEDVTLTIDGTQQLNRHGNGEHTILVNADGTLILNSALTRWGFAAARPAFVKIDGGTVVLNDEINATGFVPGSVEFLSPGGSFTANYDVPAAGVMSPNLFTNISEVETAIGISFITSAPGTIVEATDNGTSFTLTAAVAPDPNYWTGNGGATWDQASTTNFSTNTEANPLTEATFDGANAINNRITFADQFFDATVAQAVTQNNVTIAAGGVNTGNLDFSNTSVAYTIDSSDTIGIASTDRLTINGGGVVTLRGEHAYTGPTLLEAGNTLNIGDSSMDGSISNSTIVANGALVYTIAGAITQDGILNGTGTIDKAGTGTLTVTATPTHNGATTVSAGTLAFQNGSSSSSFDIATGATLEFNNSTGIDIFPATTTLSGGGTLLKTGPNLVNWAGTAATIALGSDALIDVQAGTLRLGSNANEDWTANLSDLNVASGATLLTQEANARIDAVSGDGTIQTGFGAAGYLDFTIGVDNGNGTFNGVFANGATGSPGNITKEGTGTQTLAGANTYTGNTNVEAGTLTLSDGAELRMVPTTNGTNNAIFGTATGTVNLDGTLVLDLGAADTTVANSWLLVDASALTVNYGATFAVDTLTMGTFTDDGDDTWSLTANGVTWGYSEIDGTLTVISDTTATGFSSWIAGFPNAIPAGFNDDADGDGVSNGIENILGTDPSVSTQGIIAETSSIGALSFSHSLNNSLATDVVFAYEWSTDLINWFASGDTNAEGVTAIIVDTLTVDNAAPINDEVAVSVNISAGPSTKIFARIIGTN